MASQPAPLPPAMSTGSAVCVHNEWDPLEEVIVGIADGARVPSADRGLFAIDYADHLDRPEDIPTGPIDRRVISEANEDLDAFAEALTNLGVRVRRPASVDHARPFGTPDWTSDGQSSYCPRDVLLAVGTTIIEAPMALRARYFESLAYRDLLEEYAESGATWIAAPRPRLLDGVYVDDEPAGPRLAEGEPVFDAANVLRLGRDVLYQVSCSGNRTGGAWLQRILGPGYRVHLVEGLYQGTHLDTTIAPVRQGLVVLNPERVRPHEIPAPIADWEVIWCTEPVDVGWAGPHPRATIWQAMNFLMIRPDLAVVDAMQRPLIRQLERAGVDVLPLRMRHARTLCGGFHCVSLDVRRRGSLDDGA